MAIFYKVRKEVKYPVLGIITDDPKSKIANYEEFSSLQLNTASYIIPKTYETN